MLKVFCPESIVNSLSKFYYTLAENPKETVSIQELKTFYIAYTVKKYYGIDYTVHPEPVLVMGKEPAFEFF